MSNFKNDNKGYAYYVVLIGSNGPFIDSGWEYQEDAKDRAKEYRDYMKNRDCSDYIKKIRIVIWTRKTTLSRIDPGINSNWVPLV